MADEERQRAVRAVLRAGAEVVADVVRDLVAGLSEDQRAKLVFEFADALPLLARHELERRVVGPMVPAAEADEREAVPGVVIAPGSAPESVDREGHALRGPMDKCGQVWCPTCRCWMTPR